ncbi:PspA/IM30 family protein [Mobilicoccus caccae]|uniref:Membrane protein n=1 Tax=Mobilicoccus caccae TaxID=1859295 RepID=A0ABQ6IUB4_9MICO|nr:PspA/IM30 family protein [Mobilicoccus caccae]GMA41525.1 membrane protein [Mobilicoccus caccae]
MAQKQSILGRVAQLAKANINALLDRAEDPEKMLDQLVRDYTNSIAEAEEAVAQTIAQVRMIEADHREDVEAAAEWGRKAAAASHKAEDLRGSGDTAGGDKFDNLAKVAIGRQIQYEKEARDAEPVIAQQNATVDQLKSGLTTMKTKLEDLKSRRSALVARSRTVEAQNKVQQAMGSINVMDPTSELSRFEERIKQQEALVAGRAEAASTSIEDQFAELEDYGADSEIEARLASLKVQDRPALGN